MRKISFILLLLSIVVLANTSWAGSIGNKVYGIYSETFPGILYDVENTTYTASDPDGGYLATWGATMPTVTQETDFPKEGSSYTKIVSNTGQNGLWVQFGYDPRQFPTKIPTDMSVYKDGKICFWLINDTTVTLKIEWTGNSATKSIDTMHSTWTFMTVDLSTTIWPNINFSAIKVPLGFHFTRADTTGTVCYDNFVWISSRPGTVGVNLKNISDNFTTNQITWSNVDLGATNHWKAADQYIELDLQNYATGWAIQIYTDNLAVDATPQYSGAGDPAGLIDLSSTTVALPMCWRIVDVTTNTYNMYEGTDNKLYSDSFGGQTGGYKCFLWMKDQGTASFQDGEDYVIAWEDFRGMHHAEDMWGAGGGSYNPNYIYLGAKFLNTTTPATYRTSKLTIELFYE